MMRIDKIDRQKWVKFFTHLLVISMLFFLPDFLNNYARAHRNTTMELLMYEKSAIYVAVFYLNYYLIINRTLFGKRRSFVMFIVWNLLLIIAFVLGFYFLQMSVLDVHPKHMHKEIPRMALILRGWSFVLRDVVMMILTIALSAAIKFAENWSEIEKRHQRLLATQKTDELQSLKSQLNPHFFFNTLNTIYSLVDIDPKEAQRAIHQLSKLMRHVLYESNQQESLAKEIDFLRIYISLMEKRLGDGMVRADFDNVHDSDMQLPPMLFLTLVENAFKHGNTGRKDQPIEIRIESDDAGVLTCRTYNHFLPNGTKPSKEGGIGLSNLRRRLQLIYGDGASLKTEVKGDTYTAILTIDTKKVVI